jgi:hypothetical protein
MQFHSVPQNWPTCCLVACMSLHTLLELVFVTKGCFSSLVMNILLNALSKVWSIHSSKFMLLKKQHVYTWCYPLSEYKSWVYEKCVISWDNFRMVRKWSCGPFMSSSHFVILLLNPQRS